MSIICQYCGEIHSSTICPACRNSPYKQSSLSAVAFAEEAELNRLRAENQRLKDQEKEWMWAAKLACAGNFDGNWKNGEQVVAEDTGPLYEMIRGRGWSEMPEPVQLQLINERKAAEALASKWERIALASPRVEYGWDDTAKSYAYFIYDNPNTERPRLVAKGATRSEALLAWFDQQKGA